MHKNACEYFGKMYLHPTIRCTNTRRNNQIRTIGGATEMKTSLSNLNTRDDDK